MLGKLGNMEILLEREWGLPKSPVQENTLGTVDTLSSVKSAAEVLDITEAAIRALNRQSPSQQSHRTVSNPEYTKSTVTPSVSGWESNWNINDRDAFEFADRHTFGTEVSEVTDNVSYNRSSRRGSVGSKSSTASEILQRSTMVDGDLSGSAAHQHTSDLNMTGASNTSRSSLLNSGFFTGDLKKVKVSSKKLKEVESPFDESVLLQNVSQFSNEIVEAKKTKVKDKTKAKDRKKLANGKVENMTVRDVSHQTSKVQEHLTPPRVPVRSNRPGGNATHVDFDGIFSPVSNAHSVLNNSVYVEKHIPVDVVKIDPDNTSPEDSPSDTVSGTNAGKLDSQKPRRSIFQEILDEPDDADQELADQANQGHKIASVG